MAEEQENSLPKRKHRGKLAYAVHLAIDELVRPLRGRKQGMHPVFATFTFHDNIRDKAEAAKRWRALKERIRRRWPDLKGVGVWQRQKRGAWHLHYVFNHYLAIVELRDKAVACGFGSFLNLRMVSTEKGSSTVIWSVNRVANYIARYIVRDTGDEEDEGVRMVDYLGARVATIAFNWRNGFSYLYRTGRQAWSELFGGAYLPSTCDNYWFLIRLGFEWLTLEERNRLLSASQSVSRWWNPEAYPF